MAGIYYSYLIRISKPARSGLAALLALSLLLAACGEQSTPLPAYPGPLTTIEELPPTVTPPFQAATIMTPEAAPGSPTPEPPDTVPLRTEPATTANLPPPLTPTRAPAAVPTNTALPAPVIKPTPTAPAEGTLTSDELGIGSWTDTDVLWSPSGDIFVLHVLREGTDGDFFYLVRPADSVQSSFKMPRSVFSTMLWSADGRYLSYIERDSEGVSGPVKLIDTRGDITRDRKLFSGPCTGLAWQGNTRLIAACGLAVIALPAEPDLAARPDQPEVLFRLDNNRFPGLNVDLSLIFQAFPSPDGNLLAMFGLRRQKGPLPVGEIAFYNLTTKSLGLLERNNRPVTMVDWTPDSKSLIVRNITGDWNVAYTFDYYLADPSRLRITTNLTRTNDKCDPVLGSKLDCQGTAPSSMQSSRILFAPDGDRYFYIGQRYAAKPGGPLAASERLMAGRVSTGKLDQLTESQPGERILGLAWLANGRYFYSVGMSDKTARAVVDGRTIDVKNTRSAQGGALQGFLLQATATIANLPTRAQPTLQPIPPTIPPPTAAPPPAPTTQPAATVAATTAPPLPATTAPPPPPPATTAPAAPAPGEGSATLPPGGSPPASIPATATVRVTPTPVPYIPPAQPYVPPAPIIVQPPTPSPTPKIEYPLTTAYYLAPTGKWLLAVERIAANDKVVQFQLRLLPFNLK